MAGVRWTMPPVEVTISTSTVTLAQIIAASNRRVRINRITISGKGISNADVPVLMEILDQSSAGTSGATANPTKVNLSDDETLGVTANKSFSGTEPTPGNIKAGQAIHPQGSHSFVFPPGVNDLFVGGGGRLGIRANTPAQANTWIVTAEGEE